MANSFTSTPGLYILVYALFISNLIPFCESIIILIMESVLYIIGAM